MSDWGRFLECVPWFVEPGQSVVVGSPAPWSRGSVPDLPVLSALLASATVTPVAVAGRSYELLAWGPDGSRCGWLCEPPQDSAGAPEFLERLWRVFGGTVEQFGGPSTLWLDQDEVLVVPVEEMRPYVTVAIERNGN